MSKVILTTNNAISYEVSEGESNKIIIELSSVRLPIKLSRPMDTSEFQSNITYIKPKRSGNNVILDISLKEEVPFNVVQDDNKLIIEVENPYDVVEKIREKVITKEVQAPDSELDEEVVQEESERAGFTVIEPSQLVARSINTENMTDDQALLLKEIEDAYKAMEEVAKPKVEKKVFVGAKMSLDFKDADIHNVLRLISEVSGLNVVTSDEVSGRVSVHLTEVPWDQALDVILNIKDLGMLKKDNIILVLPKAKIEAEEERRRANLKQVKQEKLEEIKAKRQELKDMEPLVLRLVPINYGDVADLQEQIKPFLSERGSVSVDERTNVLIIKDIQENVDEAANLLDRLDGVTQQVLIEARIV